MSTTTDFLAKLQKMTEEKSVQPKTSNKTAAVNLPELGSAAVLFSPKKNQTKDKSTQQKKKVDPALQAFIDQAVTTKKAAVVRQDITIPVERSDEPSQELVYEAKPGDFISAESFRATKQKTGTLNVAAYIRVSTDSSDQENSYETQERYFNQLIEANPEWNPIGVYSDYGISGTNSEKRTGFRRLLRHCKAGKIDRVICKSISRFARNTADFMMALDLLRENNVTILFEKENLDTADPTSEFILTTLGAIAQEESRSISGNINLGNKMRFKRGDVRNVDIYGYRYNGEMITSESGYKYKAVEIVKEEAVVIRRIFQEVAEGFSFADIARKLNREHIPAPESSAQKLRKVKSKKGQLNSELDTRWTNGRIAGMIRNERYTGDVLVQKSYTADYLSHEVRKNKGEVQQYYIKDHHPAIVSRELFEKVQKIVNAKSDSHKREEKTQWAFSGRLICGSCGRFFNVRNRNLNPIWFCPSAKQNNGKSICHAESVYEEQIVRVIRRAVIERFQLSSAPIRDDVSVADIMSGRYAENTDFLTHEADDFVIQMQARLENLQKIDFMERDRCFYKKQIIALQKDAEAAHKRMSLLQSQKDAMETRRDLLGDETIDEAALTERKEEIERLRKRIEQDETEAQKLEDKLDYLEDYWDELEDDYDRREEAVQWMRQLPKGREGTVAFLNGLTGEHCKAFILSITVYSPLKYSVHWFDDTRTKVEMDSNIEDFRNTASYYDGQVMRDNAYRKRFIK